MLTSGLRQARPLALVCPAPYQRRCLKPQARGRPASRGLGPLRPAG